MRALALLIGVLALFVALPLHAQDMATLVADRVAMLPASVQP